MDGSTFMADATIAMDLGRRLDPWAGVITSPGGPRLVVQSRAAVFDRQQGPTGLHADADRDGAVGVRVRAGGHVRGQALALIPAEGRD